MMAEGDRAECSQITVCKGSPICGLVGDEAVEAQRSGCVWCAIHYIFDDGREETKEVHST